MKGSKMRKCLAALSAAAMVLGLAACGSSKYSSNMDSSAAFDTAWPDKNTNTSAAMGWEEEEYEYAADDDAAAPMESISESGIDNSAYYDNRKLIKTVNLDVETKEFDRMLALLEAQVAGLGGYIEDMYTYNGSRFSSRSAVRNASMTARIPKEQLNVFLDTVSSVGNVVSRSENIQDVTLSYVDTESRKDALKVEQERLMELLKKAENMEDILSIEDRLTMVRYQLESAESQLRTYDNKVDFATVYLNLSEVEELTPVEEESTGERIVNGFADSLKNVGEGLVDFFVWFVVSIPYLIIWAIVIVAIALIVRVCIRRGKKRKAEKQAQMFVQPGPIQPMPAQQTAEVRSPQIQEKTAEKSETVTAEPEMTEVSETATAEPETEPETAEE